MDNLNIPSTEMAHPTSSSKFDFTQYKGMLKQPVLISMNMEISPIHHGVVLGKVGPNNMTEIWKSNVAKIIFYESTFNAFDFFHYIKLINLG